MMRRVLKLGILCILFFVSCNRYALLDQVPVEYKRPAKNVYAKQDTTFHLQTSEVLNPVRLQIVSDSILVIKKQIDDASPYYFSAYSIRSLRNLGSFLPNGRGPGEMLSPNMAAVSASAPCLYIRDNSLMLSCELDVMSSIRANTGVYIQTIPTRDFGPIWLPVRDSMYFSYERKGKELFYTVSTVSGETIRSFSPFQGLDLIQYFTQMSEIPTSDGINGKIAFPMVFFPMIHLLDVESGRWQAIATDPDWRKWKKLLKEPMSLDKIEYYAGATSSSKYIIALFRKGRLDGNREKDAGPEIHILDWDGNFLYRITIQDDLSGITFDPTNSYLYGIDRVGGMILRYDLTSILKNQIDSRQPI